MHFQASTSLLPALSLVHLVQSLPGPLAHAPHHCVKQIGNAQGFLCQDLPTTTLFSDSNKAVTAKPTLIKRIENDIDIISANCADNTCSIFDVSSSLVTVIDGDSLTRTPDCVDEGCSGSGSARSTSTPLGTGPALTPAATSRGPFSNGTSTTRHPKGPTGTGSFFHSGTGVSPQRNSTTFVHSTITRSVTSYTDSLWPAWTDRPEATGSGNKSNISTSCTDDVAWSNKTSIHAGGFYTSSARPNTPHQIEPSRSYVSTATYTFSGTTIKIPVPASYSGTLPAVRGPVDASNLSSTASETPVPRIYATPSSTHVSPMSKTTYSTCFTTVNGKPTGTAPITATLAKSTLICWGYHCNAESVCTDFLSRYPLAATGGPYSNGTSTSPIMYGTGPASKTAQGYPTGTGHPIISNTETDLPTDTAYTASVWPTDQTNATRNSAAYTHTGPVPPPLGPGTSETSALSAPASSLPATTTSSGNNSVVVNALSTTALYTAVTNSEGIISLSAYTTITISTQLPQSLPTAPENGSHPWAEWTSSFVTSTMSTSTKGHANTTRAVESSALPIKTEQSSNNLIDGRPDDSSKVMGGISQSQRKRSALKAHRGQKIEQERDDEDQKVQSHVGRAERKFDALLEKKRDEIWALDAAMAVEDQS